MTKENTKMYQRGQDQIEFMHNVGYSFPQIKCKVDYERRRCCAFYGLGLLHGLYTLYELNQST